MTSRRQWLGGVSAAALGGLGGIHFRQASAQPADRSEELERACRRNLKLIFDAIERFVSERGDYPERLSDLAGTYVEPSVLICPTLLSSGRLQNPQPELVSDIRKDPLTFYVWEYSSGVLQLDRPNRMVKALQRQTAIGDWVPMVRCHAHRRFGGPHLNLSFGGGIYESDLYWEALFRHICPVSYSYSSLLFEHKPPHTAHIPKRSPAVGDGALDLTGAYNALLPDAWNSDDSRDKLPEWVAGLGNDWLFEDAGIQFDVRGVVQLEGDAARVSRENKIPYFPRSAGPLPVKRPISRLHALAGIIDDDADGDETGRIRLIRQEGGVETLPLIQGRHVRHKPEGTEAPDTESKLVYRRRSFGETTGYAPHAIYHLTWSLPTAGTVIDRIEFSAGNGAACPFFMAVTIEA